MNLTANKLSAAEATRLTLGYDPVELVEAMKARGLVSSPATAHVPAQPPKEKKGPPKKVTSVKMEVVKTEPPKHLQQEFALDADDLSSANRQVSESRLKLSLELLVGAAGANKRLLQNEDWQECMSRLTKLNQNV